MNVFPYSSDNKRYHTLNYYNKNRYGKRVMKAVIDAGFTCPNADGTKGTGGCIYCRGGSGYFTSRYSDNIYEDVKKQLQAEKERISAKHPDCLITAYFQANTNTYAPVERLESLYRQAMEDKGIKFQIEFENLPEKVESAKKKYNIPDSGSNGFFTSDKLICPTNTSSLKNIASSFQELGTSGQPKI